jgi:hypothetical protein
MYWREQLPFRLSETTKRVGKNELTTAPHKLRMITRPASARLYAVSSTQ